MDSKPTFFAPHGMLENKPPYGSPCNRCGLCCMATLCVLGRHVFDLPEHAGVPCPGLERADDGTFYCGVAADPNRYASKARLVRFGVERLKRAALKIIGAGDGCDARFNGAEERDEKIGAHFDSLTQTQAYRAAARMWGIKQ